MPVIVVLQRFFDGLFRQNGAVKLVGGQPIQCFRHSLVGDLQRLGNWLTLDHFRGHGAGGDGAAAAEGFEFHIGDGIVVDFQIDFHNVAADGVPHLAHAVGVFNHAHIPGIAEVVHHFFTV